MAESDPGSGVPGNTSRLQGRRDPALLRRLAGGAGRLLRRYPFTLATLVVVVVAGFATNSVVERLSPQLTDAWGFASRDLAHGRLARLVISALVTPGGRTFWEAVVGVIVLVGASERMAGTARAVAAFWGVHLVTLIALALLGYGVVGLAPSVGPDLITLRTVGPSAGYVGSLGLVVSRLPAPWRRRAVVAVLAVLVLLVVLPVGRGTDRVVWLTDGLAHLLAFGLGLAVGWWRAPEGAAHADRPAVTPRGADGDG